MTNGFDAATVRRLLIHEAAVHAVPGRRLQDLGDAILLTDPVDPEPFWNRLCAVTWPDDADGFDRRLAEIAVLFASLGRQPHVWLTPPHDRPGDLLERLVANGFEDAGSGYLLVATDDGPAREALAARPAPEAVVERHVADRASPGAGIEVGSATAGVTDDATAATIDAVADEIVDVLVPAFGVELERAPGIAQEVRASLADPRFTHYVVRLDGRTVGVARRATFDAVSYLSSIGIVPTYRGRGIGRLITATATLDGFAAGSEFVHLGVFADNDPAIALYRSLGFVPTGEPGPDMLLVG